MQPGVEGVPDLGHARDVLARQDLVELLEHPLDPLVPGVLRVVDRLERPGERVPQLQKVRQEIAASALLALPDLSLAAPAQVGQIGRQALLALGVLAGALLGLRERPLELSPDVLGALLGLLGALGVEASASASAASRRSRASSRSA